MFFSVISQIYFYSQDQQLQLLIILDLLYKSKRKQENCTNAAVRKNA